MSQPDTTPQQQSDSPHEQDLPTHSEDGVNLTLIRWMLSMTPEQRLEHLQDHARVMWEMRNALRGA